MKLTISPKTKRVLLIVAATVVILGIGTYVTTSELQKISLRAKVEKLTSEQDERLENREEELNSQINHLLDSLQVLDGIIYGQDEYIENLSTEFANLEAAIKQSDNEVDSMDNDALLNECRRIFAAHRLD
jgi:peptidoglycan hydrolase CwlO-like protein